MMKTDYEILTNYYQRICGRKKLSPRQIEFKVVYEAMENGTLDEREAWILYYHLRENQTSSSSSTNKC